MSEDKRIALSEWDRQKRIELEIPKFDRFMMRGAGYVLAIASVSFTAKMYWDTEPNIISASLYVAFTLGLGIYQFVAFPVAIQAFFAGAYFRAFFPFIFGVGCFILSMSGTIGYMSSSANTELEKEQ